MTLAPERWRRRDRYGVIHQPWVGSGACVCVETVYGDGAWRDIEIIDTEGTPEPPTCLKCIVA